MSMTRVKYKSIPGAIEIDEKISKVFLQKCSKFESREEEENVDNLRNGSEAEKSNDAPI
jgi:hypothetical protein